MKGSRGTAMSVVGARKKTRKDLAINVQCPQCGAFPGDLCVGLSRKHVHTARFDAWRKRNAKLARLRRAKSKQRAPVEQPSVLKGIS